LFVDQNRNIQKSNQQQDHKHVEHLLMSLLDSNMIEKLMQVSVQVLELLKSLSEKRHNEININKLIIQLFYGNFHLQILEFKFEKNKKLQKENVGSTEI
jgi:hypothetical protein